LKHLDKNGKLDLPRLSAEIKAEIKDSSESDETPKISEPSIEDPLELDDW
jgi:hypothetical protein